MNIRAHSKITDLTAFSFVAVYSVEAMNFAVSSVASSRKGLALEMLISADELRNKQLKNERLLLFDARSQTAYNQGHIQGALFPPALDDRALTEYLKPYPKDTPIVAYCGSGGCMAAAVLVLKLKRFGYANTKDKEEGFEEWEKKGYPVAG